MLSEITQAIRGATQASTAVAANAATGANLVAAASVLPSMHLAGMELVNASVFTQPSVEPESNISEVGAPPENSAASFKLGSNSSLVQQGEAHSAAPIETLQTDSGLEATAGKQLQPNTISQPEGADIAGHDVAQPSTAEIEPVEAAADATLGNEVSGAETNSPAGSGASGSGGAVAQQSVAFSGVSNTEEAFKGDAPLGSDGFEGVVVRSGGLGTYEGTAFDDLLIGSDAGGDLLVGEAGSDTYVVRNATTHVQEALGQGSDQLYVDVQAYGFTAAIETVIVAASTAYEQRALDIDPLVDGLYSGWQVTGSDYTTRIVGGDGADWIYGGATNATYAGGLGNDVYTFDRQQFVYETVSGGTDIVVASANYTMQSNVEILVAGSGTTDLQLTGNDESNLIIGNAGGNVINGLSGDDTLVSGGGDDYLIGGEGINTFVVNGAEAFLGEIADFKTGIDHLLIGVDDASMSLSFVKDQFNGVAGEVLFGNGHWMFDWDGDANFDAILTSQNDIAALDITLINPDQIPAF